MNKYIPGHGNPNAKILFIGEAPSYEEEVAGLPYVGPAGRVLDECLKNAGIYRGNVWITNVFKYMIVPQSKEGRKIPASVRAEQAGVDIQKSIQELRVEIDQIKPNVIVPLGGTALWAVYGTDAITKWRGSILHAWNYKCIPTYHPAHLIHSEAATGDYWQKYILEFDLRRVRQQSEFPDIRRPSRNLVICRNSAQLYDFIRSGEGKPKLAIDIEALTCVPVCVSLAFDHVTGMCVPLWNKTPIAKISEIPSSDLASIWQMLYDLFKNPKWKKVGQNFKYDEDKLARLGLPIDRLYSDTLLKSFAISPELPASLAFTTSTYTEEPYYKDEGLDFDYHKHPIDDLFYYGAKDAPVTLEIDDKMEPDLDELGVRDFYYNFLMELHGLYLGIECQGMRVIEENRKELLRKYLAWTERLKYEMFKLTEQSDFNVNSPKQVAVLLYEVLKLPRREGTGEEVLTQLLANAAKKPQHKQVIENILEQRRVNKTISTYLMAMADYDGRMRTSYFICLDTGRTGTNLLDPPIRPSHEIRDEQNKKKKKSIGAAFQVLTKHGDVGGDIRRMYGPDIGEIFLNADSSQAEARVVALLANDEDMLKMYDTNDIHALTASWFMGGTEDDYSKKKLGYECNERFLGKTLRHAGHLGAKKRRAMLEINTTARKYKIPVNVSEAFCDKALNIFHRKCPNIRNVFHQGIIDELGRTKRLIASVPYGVNSKIGGVRTFHDRWGDELFRRAFSYIPQRSISDNTKAAALRIKKKIPQIKICVESHDALTFSMPLIRVPEWGGIIKEEMERPIRFDTCSLPRHDLSIPCDLEIGENYCDFKKVKL